MRAMKYAAAILAVLVLGTASASVAVNVTLANPEQSRDDDFRSPSKRKGVIADLTRHFEQLDKRYLKKGERLYIEVLNARLAGEYESWRRNFNDVHMLRVTTPPRFEIRCVLRHAGKVIAMGSASRSSS